MTNTFINTKKEIFFGDSYFKQVCGECGFDWRLHKKELAPYFAERDFSVSGMYSAYYSHFNGLTSDRYMSMDLYFFYALPCLNKRNYMRAYGDKNNYEWLFPGVRQPQTVLKRRNGFYYAPSEDRVSSVEAESILANVKGDCIVKPAIESGSGKGVELLDKTQLPTQLNRIGPDLIVQRKVRQHMAMAQLNPSSLNTMRLLTYRDLSGTIHFMHDQSFLRIGGAGMIKDNVGAGCGAGLCLVRDDGTVGDVIVGHCTLNRGSMERDHGVRDFRVPNMASAIDFVKTLHKRIHYLDFIGWDIAIAEDGSPMFIELNTLPDVYGNQSVSGPMFGKWLDEVMDRIASVQKISGSYDVNVFRGGYDYIQQIEGPAYAI